MLSKTSKSKSILVSDLEPLFNLVKTIFNGFVTSGS